MCPCPTLFHQAVDSVPIRTQLDLIKQQSCTVICCTTLGYFPSAITSLTNKLPKIGKMKQRNISLQSIFDPYFSTVDSPESEGHLSKNLLWRSASILWLSTAAIIVLNAELDRASRELGLSYSTT